MNGRRFYWIRERYGRWIPAEMATSTPAGGFYVPGRAALQYVGPDDIGPEIPRPPPDWTPNPAPVD